METGEQIQLVVGLIFAISLIGSLFIRQGLGIGKGGKYLLLWLLAGLALVVAYSYRHMVSSVADRVLSELVPGSIYIEDDYLVVSKGSNGHFYINVSVNGKQIRFLIDTGASEIMLSQEDAKEAGVKPESNVTKLFSTANGDVKAIEARANLKIGHTTFKNFRLYVSKADTSTSLLGMSFLNRFSEIKLDNDKLYLRINTLAPNYTLRL